MTDPTKQRRKIRWDLSASSGLLLAVGGIALGLLLEGGSVMDVAQGTAALIVLGGTAGAVMVACPKAACLGAIRKLRVVFLGSPLDAGEELNQILIYAARARKSGVVSLEPELDRIENPFLRKALALAVDGADIQQIREIMKLEMEAEEQEDLGHARVFEAAGGYAPTIGILGAVLGLIQVMKRLENIDEVGKGIAVAFVATIYGVGSANLFFLPAGSKVRAYVREKVSNQEMLIEGVCGIVEGMNPKMIARKLDAFVRNGSGPEAPARRPGGVKAPAA